MNELMDLAAGGMQNGPGEGLGLPDITNLFGGGAASRGVDVIRLRKAYNAYVIETQSTGQQPLPFDQWVKQMNGSQATGNPYQPR